MNDVIVYRPYKFHRWSFPFTALIALLAYAGAVCFTEEWSYVLVFGVIGTGCAWLTEHLYNLSKLKVVFDQQGVKTSGRTHQETRSMLWGFTNYAYYAKGYKGDLFIALSTNSLNRQDVERLVGRCANTGKICMDGVLIIYMNPLQDISPIQALIDSKVACVVHFDS